MPTKLPILALACLFTAGVVNCDQIPIENADRRSQDGIRIAIIGSGVAGASAAYALSEEARDLVNLNITVFEAEGQVGGRIKYADQYGDARQTVQVGAVSFSDRDWCIADAVKAAGLDTSTLEQGGSWGVWNGGEFVLQRKSATGGSSWWEFTKGMWRYGVSPWKLSRSVSATSKGFKSYAKSLSVLNGIMTEFDDRALDPKFLQSADSYCDVIGVGQTFKNEIVEPHTREVLGRNLEDLTGLDMLLSMEDGDRKTVSDGNHRLIDRLLRLSDVNLSLHSRVSSIGRGIDRRYRLDFGSNKLGRGSEYLEFDVVIIAAPFQSNGITFEDMVMTKSPPLRPYVQTHVTHFATSSPISSTYFNITTAPPDRILTTKGFDEFFSIESLGRTCNRHWCEPYFEGPYCDECNWDNLYRIHSPQPIDDSTILSLIGKGDDAYSGTLETSGVNWVHKQTWKHAAPIFDVSKEFLNEIEIAPSMFYTSGAEELVTSMEMSCRVGMNVGLGVALRAIEF